MIASCGRWSVGRTLNRHTLTLGARPFTFFVRNQHKIELNSCNAIFTVNLWRKTITRTECKIIIDQRVVGDVDLGRQMAIPSASAKK